MKEFVGIVIILVEFAILQVKIVAQNVILDTIFLKTK
jgi:hypothetical protein